MSKVSEAKAAQGYIEKPVARVCANCQNFACERLLPDWYVDENKRRLANGRDPFTVEEYGQDVNKRCGIGGFAVKKSATCRLFLMRSELGASGQRVEQAG